MGETALLGIAEYDSDSEQAEGEGRSGGAAAQRTPKTTVGQGSDDDSYFHSSGSDSEDSATQRKKAADRRLVDMQDSAQGPTGDSSLPPPLMTLDQISSRPSFLDPEATRPLAQALHRNRPSLVQPGPQSIQGSIHTTDKTVTKGPGWDIARMAPPMKGQVRAGAAMPVASANPGAVITAGPKRAKPVEDSEDGIVTAAQIAMLGGQWQPSARQDEAAGQAAVALGPGAPHKRKSTSSMGVNEFMDKGIGGAALPRARQERKDREKLKRAKGQSSVNEWKTEAEMVLRQQYDS